MIKNNKRRQQMNQYLKQLNELNWHHPSEFKDEVPTRPPKEAEEYYQAQLCLILMNNYGRSTPQIEKILKLPRTTVFRLLNKYEQEVHSFEELEERIDNGENW
ncbi:hypothetical protein [Leuconostoc pseudomesenteroides]|uniref:hypothetical protein n=1 Tax=Leuconostoc pseudomesenteroides TaxID=33968 RepID=UPI0040355461